MQWREELSVGIPEIDAQHRTLFGLISNLEGMVAAKKRWSDVHAGLGRLTEFVQVHFTVEESLMRIHNSPELAEHAAEHRNYAAQMKALVEKSLRVDVSAEMVAFLREWFDRHITTRDQRYAEYFSQFGKKRVGLPTSGAKKYAGRPSPG